MNPKIPVKGKLVFIPDGYTIYIYKVPTPVQADEEPSDGAASD